LSSTEAIDAHKERLQEATENSKEIGSEVEQTVEEHSKDATEASKETADDTAHGAGGLAEHGDEKVAGVSSSSS
jgi:vacuolar-type H+-ATPase subunit H